MPLQKEFERTGVLSAQEAFEQVTVRDIGRARVPDDAADMLHYFAERCSRHRDLLLAIA